MKPKHLLRIIGLRPKPVKYGHSIERVELPDDGVVEFARWLCPGNDSWSVSAGELADLRRFLREGDFAIDIGAHVGDSTLPIALACGASGLVLAFEPNPAVFEVLKVTSGLNRAKTNIVPQPYAVTDRAGTFRFQYSDRNYSNGGQFANISIWRHGHAFPLDVEGRPLQSIVGNNYAERLSRLRYIKVDVEGGELALLRSIAGIISEWRPYLKLEVYKRTRAEQRRDLFQFITRQGYAIQKVEEGVTLFGEQLTERDVMRWRHYDIFAIPR